MINSNFYGSDTIYLPTNSQAARAANVAYLMLQFRRRLERQEIKPIMVQGLVPLCSWQYERMFNTSRVPGIECDKIVHYENIKHIAVLHKGRYFKLDFYHNGRLLNACELQFQIEQILNSKEPSTPAELHLAALTAWDRTKWAETRNKYFSSGINKATLEIVESAAFVLTLDDEPYVFTIKSSPAEYGFFGRQLLHGKGYDRWFDKSFNLCVATNGRVS